ncbi:MAG: hypothetical protein ABJC61_14210 [Acidobacteriota bacterium]
MTIVNRRRRMCLVAGGVFLFRGVGARDAPAEAEVRIARALRHAAIAAAERGRVNPAPATPEVVVEARDHFADHRASCHGNDGRGQTGMGQLMNPRVPDMTAPATRRRARRSAPGRSSRSRQRAA